MMERRVGTESGKPDQRKECAEGYDTENQPGIRQTSSPWQHPGISSQSSHIHVERMLGKIPGTHPESQQSSLAGSVREYQYLGNIHPPQALAIHFPGGMTVDRPMTGNPSNRAPGVLNERPQYHHTPAVPVDPASLQQQGPVTSFDMRNLWYPLQQVGRPPPQYGSEPNLAFPRGMPNAGQLTHTDQFFAEHYSLGPLPPNVRYPGEQYGGRPSLFVPAARFQAPTDTYSRGMQTTANIQSAVGAGGRPMLLYDQHQQALQDETQHVQPCHVRQGYHSFGPPAAGYVAPGSGRGISRDPEWPVTEVRTQELLYQGHPIPQASPQLLAYGQAHPVSPDGRAHGDQRGTPRGNFYGPRASEWPQTKDENRRFQYQVFAPGYTQPMGPGDRAYDGRRGTPRDNMLFPGAPEGPQAEYENQRFPPHRTPVPQERYQAPSYGYTQPIGPYGRPHDVQRETHEELHGQWTSEERPPEDESHMLPRQREPSVRSNPQAPAQGGAQSTPPDGRTQGWYGGGARPKEYPYRSNLPQEQHRRSNEDESPGILPYLDDEEAEPSQSPATSYVASSSGRSTPRTESPENWISNRPETEGALPARQSEREGESSEYPHSNVPHSNSPSTAPEPRPEAVRRSLSTTVLEKQRMEKIREQHRHIEENCSQSLEDLHGELVELTKVQEIMDLWQYHSARTRAKSLVGCYQWYQRKSENCIQSLIHTHRGAGDDSAAHHVFSLLMETNMKTGNLLLYFKEQGRQDIVKCLREHHPSCPVCDQLN